MNAEVCEVCHATWYSNSTVKFYYFLKAGPESKQGWTKYEGFKTLEEALADRNNQIEKHLVAGLDWVIS